MVYQMILWALALFLALPLVCCDDGEAEDEEEPDGDGGSNEPERHEPELVGPIERDGKYVLEMTDGVDTVRFECQAEIGGLITELSLNGENVIADDAIGDMYGSTFWPSPQEWGWPPPLAIDSDPYAVEVDEEIPTIALTSDPDPDLNVRVVKRFTPDLENMAINLEYVIQNTGDEAASFAPWEITRVTTGGLTFFPTGPGGEYTVEKANEESLPTTTEGGVTWFEHTEDAVPRPMGNYKLYADGARGWLAHVKGDLLFVKSFEDEPPESRAPNEGEIEIYVKGGGYEEVENQGAYQEIPPGGEITWNVKWTLRNLPADAEATVGNQPLVDYIDGLVG